MPSMFSDRVLGILYRLDSLHLSCYNTIICVWRTDMVARISLLVDWLRHHIENPDDHLVSLDHIHAAYGRLNRYNVEDILHRFHGASGPYVEYQDLNGWPPFVTCSVLAASHECYVTNHRRDVHNYKPNSNDIRHFLRRIGLPCTPSYIYPRAALVCNQSVGRPIVTHSVPMRVIRFESPEFVASCLDSAVASRMSDSKRTKRILRQSGYMEAWDPEDRTHPRVREAYLRKFFRSLLSDPSTLNGVGPDGEEWPTYICYGKLLERINVDGWNFTHSELGSAMYFLGINAAGGALRRSENKTSYYLRPFISRADLQAAVSSWPEVLEITLPS